MEGWPKRLSRRDAGAFLKGVKRYGRPERLADIAQETASAMAALPMSALQALWRGLISYAPLHAPLHAPPAVLVTRPVACDCIIHMPWCW